MAVKGLGGMSGSFADAARSLGEGATGTIEAVAFGSYQLMTRIGQGGMAEVFLATRPGPAGFRKVQVIKRLHPHLEDETGFRAMFLDEARLGARLSHPNVVQTFEVGEVDGCFYLAMEYLDGQPLSRVLRAAAGYGEPLPIELVVRIFLDVLEGLHYAHELRDFDGATPLGVVHRDVSPANIFITYDGVTKVLDFGIAKAGSRTTETQAGQIKGKYGYIAPEQARAQPSDRRSDIFSVGVVMWESLTGERLFKGDNELMTLQNALSAEVPRLDRVADVPKELAAIVARALERNPDERFADAQSMREALERFATKHGAWVARDELGHYLAALFADERAGQRRVLDACMRASLTAVAPASADFEPELEATPSHFRPVDTTAPEPPASARGRGGVWWAIALLVAVLLALLATPMGFLPPPAPNGRSAAPGSAPIEPGARAPSLARAPRATSQDTQGRLAAPPSPPAAPAARTPTVTPATIPVEPASAATAPVTAVAPSTPEQESRSRPAPPRAARAPTHRAVAAEGRLTLDTTPWSHVSLGGRRLGTTPLIRVMLPAGSHVLTFENPEQGLLVRRRVVVTAGSDERLRMALR